VGSSFQLFCGCSEREPQSYPRVFNFELLREQVGEVLADGSQSAAVITTGLIRLHRKGLGKYHNSVKSADGPYTKQLTWLAAPDS
jgi:hypothetical protein